MSVVVSSVGLITPLGVGRTAFQDAWRRGELAPGAAIGEGGLRVSTVPCREFFPEHTALIRRMDRLSRMICGALGLLRDEPGGLGDLGDMGLAVGTDLGTLEETFRFLGRLRDKGPALASPMDFPNLVPNAGAGYGGILLGLLGPSVTFCNHEACGDDAVAWAAEGVELGRFGAAIGGGAEEWGTIRDRAQDRLHGTGVGSAEGAAMVLLEQSDRAEARGHTPLARWLGSAAATCPPRSPGRLPGPDAAGPLRALADGLLRDHGRTVEDLGVVLPSPAEHPAITKFCAGLGRPVVDTSLRMGRHPADGAVRVAIGALLLADPSFAIDPARTMTQGNLVLIVTIARGGALRLSLLERL